MKRMGKPSLQKVRLLPWKMAKWIGIGLIDRTEVTSDVPIRFSTAGIGGPSAGLMFSLAIYTQISDPGLPKWPYRCRYRNH